MTRIALSLVIAAGFTSIALAQNPAPQPPRPLPAPTPMPAPMAPAATPIQPGTIPEPTPIYSTPGMTPYDLYPPKLPPYAWPTYAPYNNFSRVGCPEYYPADAFPFIGPVSPFPKVPPGWRSVKLEWNDGFWYFSKLATKHDYWRLRYW
jgi:hypothetical protein